MADHVLRCFSVAISVLVESLVFDLAGIFVDPEVVFFVGFDHRKFVVRSSPITVNISNEKNLAL